MKHKNDRCYCNKIREDVYNAKQLLVGWSIVLLFLMVIGLVASWLISMLIVGLLVFAAVSMTITYVLKGHSISCSLLRPWTNILKVFLKNLSGLQP